jgi:multidrug efflux pump
MNLSAPFIARPVATTLLTLALVLAGALAFGFLPVAPLPQVDFPTIQVSAQLPGADPETMASSVAAPLERQLGQIASVTEMTSSSSLGTTNIVLQFDLSRNIDGAARDVEAAINAARSYLPANLPSNPIYRKVNPADAPIMILALTSHVVSRGRMFDAASTILQQRLSQVSGVGQVFAAGGALPAVRVELNPMALNKYGLGLEDVRARLQAATINRPKGQLADGVHASEIVANDQLLRAADYAPLIVAYQNGAPVTLSAIADVEDSVENVRNDGLMNRIPAVFVVIFRQPGANIIDTVDRVRALVPELRATIPAAVDISVTLDRSTTIRESLHDVERTLVISVVLVTLVVFVFLRSVRATAIPAVAVPVSLVGTFGLMYLLGFSLNNLSLMALTVATGFVIDDAIVVLENIISPPGAWRRPLRGGRAGRTRDRLHRAVDQHLAHRRLHPAPPDGRDRGTAVPRVRDDAVGGDRDLHGRVTHHHPDDVRDAASGQRAGRSRSPRQIHGACVRPHAPHV